MRESQPPLPSREGFLDVPYLLLLLNGRYGSVNSSCDCGSRPWRRLNDGGVHFIYEVALASGTEEADARSTNRIRYKTAFCDGHVLHGYVLHVYVVIPSEWSTKMWAFRWYCMACNSRAEMRRKPQGRSRCIQLLRTVSLSSVYNYRKVVGIPDRPFPL